MVCLTGNVCRAVVISAQVLYFPVRGKTRIQQTCVQQYDFIINLMFQIVLFTGDACTMNKQRVHCVPQLQVLTGLPKYTH